MAGFFGLFNYAKPGKGVSRDEPEKHRFFLFFELYFRKFWKLMGLNIMYAVIIFPLISAVVIYLLSAFGIEAELFTDDVTIYIFSQVLFGLPSPINWILVGASAVLMGPATAAATYIWRNFSRQEHAWVFTDFFERLKSNFRQGLMAGILDLVVFFSFIMYWTMDLTTNVTLAQYLILFRYVAVVVFFIYAFMRYYIYLLIVTFDINFIGVLRNAWIFSILGIVRNLCTTIFGGLVLAGTFFMPLPLLGLITCSLCGFITIFNAWPVVQKFMLKTPEQEMPQEEAIFTDDVTRKRPDEES